MKKFKFYLVGVLFGIIMTKSEVISWYRIYEMFKFESFHMYGVIGSAVMLGAFIVFIMKRTGMKTLKGTEPNLPPKEKAFTRYIVGGTLFGLGWALTGACPGPMFVLAGHGIWPFLVVIASAMLGTFTYGALRKYLPH